MPSQFSEILWVVTGLMAGGCIGLAFGALQQRALRRNEQLQQSGKLNNGWIVMPRSMGRVFYLILALVLVQILCPLLFANKMHWWVSAGVALGYGSILYRQLRNKLSNR
jgi:hypothetical protein